MASSTSRVLPMPGSPSTVASCARRSRNARRYASCSSESSCSRPTCGVRAGPRGPPSRPSSRKHSTGSSNPLRVRAPAASTRTSWRTSRSVVAASRISPSAASRLQPGREVRGAAEHGRAAAGEHLPGRDAGAHLELDRPPAFELVVQAPERGVHLVGGAHRARWRRPRAPRARRTSPARRRR